MGTQQKLNSADSTLQIQMDGVSINEDSNGTELLLGCYVQRDLIQTNQVEYVCAKLKNRLVGQSCLKYCAPYDIRKSITEGLFNSVLTYCLPVFGGLDRGSLHQLQILQNKAATIVCQSTPRTSRNELFNKLGWLTVRQLIAYHDLLSLFKIEKTGQPEYLAEIFSRKNRFNKIIVPNNRLELSRKSFCFRSATFWNKVPSVLKNDVSLLEFKQKVADWVKMNIPRFNDEQVQAETIFYNPYIITESPVKKLYNLRILS